MALQPPSKRLVTEETLGTALAQITSLGGVILSAANPTVLELKNVNEWAVSGAVAVQLPTVPAGSQFTVHVTSGFQNLTWPNGTIVYGDSDLQDVWVTLIRTTTGWTVLIPSPGGAGSVDTGWMQVLGAANLGNGVQFTVGDASMLGTGWTVTTATMMAYVYIRRSGGFLLVRIDGGFTATAGAVEAAISVPTPAGLVGDNATMRVLNTATVGGVKVSTLYGCSVETGAGGKLKILVPAGARASGSVVSTEGVLMFPIAPTTTWGE